MRKRTREGRQRGVKKGKRDKSKDICARLWVVCAIGGPLHFWSLWLAFAQQPFANSHSTIQQVWQLWEAEELVVQGEEVAWGLGHCSCVVGGSLFSE